MSDNDVRMTPEQAMSTTPDDSVWVTASAGTGKTHVLTARVLRLLVRGTKPNKILCLTYTKAAANEMKTRIFEELGKWTSLDDAKLSNEIYKRTDEKSDTEMLEHARGLFAQVLDVPGGMNIQTIHSFCQSLLGRFPAEADLTPHFQVMDERTAQEYLEKARDQVLTQAQQSNDTALLAAIERIAHRKNSDQFQSLLKSIASERRHFNKLVATHGSLDNLIEACATALDVKSDQTPEGYLKTNLDDSAIDADNIKNLALAFADGTPRETAYAETLSNFISKPKDRAAIFGELYNVVLTKELEPPKKCPTNAVLAKHPEITAPLGQHQTWLKAMDTALKKLEAFYNTKAVLQLSDAIISRFNDNKRKQSLMDYDDLIFKTDLLLSQPHIAPWVLYKLDGGIDHILVDEAQDTNPEQWNMVETLSEEFFAGASSYGHLRSIFAVGDTKQSIFSFQRADPVAFKQAKDRIGARVKNADLSFHSVGLHRSFRSTSPILELTDKVFSPTKAGLNLTPENEVIEHQTNRKGDAGLVELWPTAFPDTQVFPGDWEVPTEQHRAQSAEGRLAIRIAERIKQMIDGGEILESKARPIMARDIMVLVRRRKDFSNHLIRALKDRSINVAGSDRMVLSEQLAVMDLMALASFALLPDDDLNLATVLKSPLVGLDEDSLFKLAYGRKNKSLWQVLNARKAESPFNSAHAFLANILAQVDYDTPFQFFSKTLNLGGRKKIIARLGQDANDPIDELLAIAQQYEYLHKPSLQGFVHWMGNDEGQIKRDLDQNRDEVRILTVHGAKGLQAPIVFLPDTCQTPSARGETLLKLKQGDQQTPNLLFWTGDTALEVGPLGVAKNLLKEKQEAEHRRLLYVAMTRAEDRLYITGWETSKERPENCWYNLIADGFGELKNIEEIPQVWHGEDKVVLRYSCEQEAKATSDKKQPINTYNELKLPLWASSAPESDIPNTKKPLTPSSGANEDSEPVSSPLSTAQGVNEISPYKRGNLIHKLLEILPLLPNEKRQAAALNYLEKPAHRLKGETAQDIWNKLEPILNHQEFAPLFAENSRAEVSLTGVIGDNVINAQIDRLKVSDDEVLIVDYKTNRPPPKEVSKVPRSYLQQMALYSALVAKIYPDKKIKSALLWTEEARFMPLDEGVLAKY